MGGLGVNHIGFLVSRLADPLRVTCNLVPGDLFPLTCFLTARQGERSSVNKIGLHVFIDISIKNIVFIPHQRSQQKNEE